MGPMPALIVNLLPKDPWTQENRGLLPSYSISVLVSPDKAPREPILPQAPACDYRHVDQRDSSKLIQIKV